MITTKNFVSRELGLLIHTKMLTDKEYAGLMEAFKKFGEIVVDECALVCGVGDEAIKEDVLRIKQSL